MAPELLFVLVLRVCGDAAPPCRTIEVGHYLSEADCRREARTLGWSARGAVRCVLKVMEGVD